jgi:acyl carrier protein
MTEAEVRSRMRAYITDNFLYMRRDLKLGDDDSLLRKGVIDSLGVMEVLGFVEETFGLHVDQNDITEENFGTLNAITRYVAARTTSATA